MVTPCLLSKYPIILLSETTGSKHILVRLTSKFNQSFIIMKKTSLLIGFMFALISQLNAQTADEIFDRYYDATGGKTLWNGVKSYVVKQDFVANAPTDFSQEIKVSLEHKAILKTKTILKRDFIYGVNTSEAFFKVPTGSRDKNVVYETKDLSDKDKNTIKREMTDGLVPFRDYQEKGYIATYVGLKADNGKPVHQVELNGKDIKYDLFFDATTYLLSKQKAKLASGEEVTQEFTQYTKSPYGVSYPSAGTYYSSVEKRNTKLSSNVTFNDKIEDSVFKK